LFESRQQLKLRGLHRLEDLPTLSELAKRGYYYQARSAMAGMPGGPLSRKNVVVSIYMGLLASSELDPFSFRT
jgi:hypothetical protein